VRRDQKAVKVALYAVS